MCPCEISVQQCIPVLTQLQSSTQCESLTHMRTTSCYAHAASGLGMSATAGLILPVVHPDRVTPNHLACQLSCLLASLCMAFYCAHTVSVLLQVSYCLWVTQTMSTQTYLAYQLWAVPSHIPVYNILLRSHNAMDVVVLILPVG